MPGWLKSKAEMEDENRLLQNGNGSSELPQVATKGSEKDHRRHSASLLVKP